MGCWTPRCCNSWPSSARYLSISCACIETPSVSWESDSSLLQPPPCWKRLERICDTTDVSPLSPERCRPRCSSSSVCTTLTLLMIHYFHVIVKQMFYPFCSVLSITQSGISFTPGSKTGITVLQEVLNKPDVMRLSHIMQLALDPLHRRKIGCGTTTSRYSLSARLMLPIIAAKRQQGLSFHAGHGISLV